jgi:hypothetical protein
MKRSASTKDWLPLAKGGGRVAELPTGEAFRSEWIDFERGIRVGNIEPHERITQILKFYLEQHYHTSFVTDPACTGSGFVGYRAPIARRNQFRTA